MINTGKKVGTEIFIYRIYQTIMLETNSNVFADDFIESIKKNNIDKQVEGIRFNFKCVSSLRIMCDKVNQQFHHLLNHLIG